MTEGLTARVIPGPKPSAMDALIESSNRGYGPLKGAFFQRGVTGVAYGIEKERMDEATSKRARAWMAEGVKWAHEEIARRAASKAVS